MEVALWGLVTDVPYDVAALLGVPVAAESGLASTWSAAGVVAAQVATTSVARHLAHQQRGLGVFGWQCLAAGAGVGVRTYRERLLRVTLRRHAQELEARTQHAYLAGQNDVAMGADSVVDRLCRIWPLLGESAEAAELRDLSKWKHSLATKTTTTTAFYLADVARGWERQHKPAPF